MRNRYEIRGLETAIFIKCVGKDYEAIIDTSELDKLLSIDTTWYGFYSSSNIYVKGNKYIGKQLDGRRKQINIKLHRFLMDAPNGLVVDHINHDTLNNKRSNMRLITTAENGQNRKGAQVTNACGVRGIWFCKQNNKYKGIVIVGGKRIHAGYFKTLEEAEIGIKKARARLMPFSQEALAN